MSLCISISATGVAYMPSFDATLRPRNCEQHCAGTSASCSERLGLYWRSHISFVHVALSHHLHTELLQTRHSHVLQTSTMRYHSLSFREASSSTEKRALCCPVTCLGNPQEWLVMEHPLPCNKVTITTPRRRQDPQTPVENPMPMHTRMHTT